MSFRASPAKGGGAEAKSYLPISESIKILSFLRKQESIFIIASRASEATEAWQSIWIFASMVSSQPIPSIPSDCPLMAQGHPLTIVYVLQFNRRESFTGQIARSAGRRGCGWG
jgi:hypothetical protein